MQIQFLINQMKYIINRYTETGVIEYKLDTLNVNIIPIKKSNSKLEMWEVNARISDESQIKWAFSWDKFSLINREKTSDIEMRHNAILSINWTVARFNKISYVIIYGIIYRDTWYKSDLAPRTVIAKKESLEYSMLVIDGRSELSVGISLYYAAVEFKNRGWYWVYNLDAWGSITLYFNG